MNIYESIKNNLEEEEINWKKEEKQLLDDMTKVHPKALKRFYEIFKEQGKDKFAERVKKELDRRGIKEAEAPQVYERGNAPFESKRVPEDRIREDGYQYFSTHGLGPGTHPRDVRVRELDIELPSGWVTFKTDRPLTSEELEWYGIQPETRNREFRQRFGLEEAEKKKSKKELEDDKIVESENDYNIIKGIEHFIKEAFGEELSSKLQDVAFDNGIVTFKIVDGDKVLTLKIDIQSEILNAVYDKAQIHGRAIMNTLNKDTPLTESTTANSVQKEAEESSSKTISCNDLSNVIGKVIGYDEGVDKIVIVDIDGDETTQPLAVKGLNIYGRSSQGENGCNFSYYNANDGQLHMLNMDYIDKLKLFNGDNLIYEIVK